MITNVYKEDNSNFWVAESIKLVETENGVYELKVITRMIRNHLMTTAFGCHKGHAFCQFTPYKDYEQTVLRERQSQFWGCREACTRDQHSRAIEKIDSIERAMREHYRVKVA